METVVLDGIKYTKASVVAEQFNYTSDYIGQLCRAKKVRARLVGRTWFVDPTSLSKHKQEKYQKTTDEPEKDLSVADTPNKIKIHRVDVHAPLKNKTVKLTAASASSKPHHSGSAVEKNQEPSILYKEDGENLIPDLYKDFQLQQETMVLSGNTTKKFLHIEPASAKKLKIKAPKAKRTSFSSTELPDVALSGKLDISTYNAPKNTEEAVPAAPAPQVKSPIQSPAPVSKSTPSPQKSDKNEKTQVVKKGDINLRKKPTKSLKKQSTSTPLLLRISPLLGTLLAAAVSFLILTLSAEVQISEVLSTSKLSFELEKIAELFAR